MQKAHEPEGQQQSDQRHHQIAEARGNLMIKKGLDITAGNARLAAGTLTWTITPASGSPVTVTTPLTDISGQYSYALRVPFESVVGSATLSPNALKLNSATTSYLRTNVTLSVGGTNYPPSIVAPALGNFSFNTSDRGRMEEVALSVSAPAVGMALVSPAIVAAPRIMNGESQITVDGTLGQNSTLLASTDLVNWTAAVVFLCTNSPMTISDNVATNYPQRFYRISQ